MKKDNWLAEFAKDDAIPFDIASMDDEALRIVSVRELHAGTNTKTVSKDPTSYRKCCCNQIVDADATSAVRAQTMWPQAITQ